jgi:hypothetical protein
MVSRCAFCLSRPPELSEEHIWDDWVSRMYVAKSGRQKFVITEYDASETPFRSFIKTSINKTLPVVCEPCNNGWMSDIVNLDARPSMKDLIFHTREQTLLSRGLLGLARFTFLKSAVIDAVRTDSAPFYSVPIRQQFMSTRSFPPGVQIWLAAYGSSQHHGHAWASYFKPNDRPLQGVEFFFFTYAVGFLVLQLACARWIVKSRRHEQLPSVTPSRQWGDVSKGIYPLTAPMAVSWPPRFFLDAKGLFRFKERFHTLRVTNR